jgi:hypothetical protein
VFAAGEEDAVVLLLLLLLLLEERAHEEEEKEAQASGRRQAVVLGAEFGLDGTRQATRDCSSRKGRSSTAKRLGSRRVGGMMMQG